MGNSHEDPYLHLEDPFAEQELSIDKSKPMIERYNFHKNKYISYPWAILAVEDCEYIPLGPYKKPSKAKLGKQYWPYYDAFVKYIKALKWEKDYDNTKGVTMMELVVDFELASGMRFRHPKHGNKTPWNVKCEMFKKLYQFLLACYKRYEGPSVAKNVRTLISFGTTNKDKGLDIRPKFLMKEYTELCVVENILEYVKEGGVGNVSSNRKGAVNHLLNYKFCFAQPVITLETTKLFHDHLDRVQHRLIHGPKFRLRGKQTYRPH